MFKKIKLLGAALLISAVSVSSSFAAGDPFEGDFSGHCPGSQCFVEVVKKGKGYTATFQALERYDATKVLCKAVIPMTRSKRSLSGTYKGEPISISENKAGDIKVKTAAKCGKFKIGGGFAEYGDY